MTVWPAGGLSSSHPTCLYYTVLTKSLCLTTFSSIAMEKPCRCMYLTTVQMHLFEKENETLTYLEQTGILCLYLNANTNKNTQVTSSTDLTVLKLNRKGLPLV